MLSALRSISVLFRAGFPFESFSMTQHIKPCAAANPAGWRCWEVAIGQSTLFGALKTGRF
jgi:hypothetical protein